MSSKSTLLVIIYLLAFSHLALGIWEAIISTHYKPTCDVDGLPCGLVNQVFAFVTTKAVLNLLSGSTYIIFFTLFGLNKIGEEAFKKTTNSTSLSFGVSVWGLVDYFNFYPNELKEVFPMYGNVLFVEMIVFFTLLGIVCLFSCISCMYICMYTKEQTDYVRHETKV